MDIFLSFDSRPVLTSNLLWPRLLYPRPRKRRLPPPRRRRRILPPPEVKSGFPRAKRKTFVRIALGPKDIPHHYVSRPSPFAFPLVFMRIRDHLHPVSFRYCRERETDVLSYIFWRFYIVIWSSLISGFLLSLRAQSRTSSLLMPLTIFKIYFIVVTYCVLSSWSLISFHRDRFLHLFTSLVEFLFVSFTR